MIPGCIWYHVPGSNCPYPQLSECLAQLWSSNWPQCTLCSESEGGGVFQSSIKTFNLLSYVSINSYNFDVFLLQNHNATFNYQVFRNRIHCMRRFTLAKEMCKTMSPLRKRNIPEMLQHLNRSFSFQSSLSKGQKCQKLQHKLFLKGWYPGMFHGFC